MPAWSVKAGVLQKLILQKPCISVAVHTQFHCSSNTKRNCPASIHKKVVCVSANLHKPTWHSLPSLRVRGTHCNASEGHGTGGAVLLPRGQKVVQVLPPSHSTAHLHLFFTFTSTLIRLLSVACHRCLVRSTTLYLVSGYLVHLEIAVYIKMHKTCNQHLFKLLCKGALLLNGGR